MFINLSDNGSNDCLTDTPRASMAGRRGRGLWLATLVVICLTTVADRHHTSSCTETWDGVPEGELSSPNFPSAYNPNDLCVWNIQDSDATSRVVLTFQAFMLEDSENCQNDFVEIGEQTSSRMQHGQRMCGQKSEFQVVSNTNKLTMVFQSDGKNQFPGFRATFKIMPGSQIKTSPEDTSNSAENDKPENGATSDNKEYDMCDCGKSPSKTRRIVGGRVAEENTFPWLVVLVTTELQTSAHCGGVLLTPRHLITAAHCTKNKTPVDYRVVAGAYNLFVRESETYSVRNVARFIPHERYDRITEENDIAILELEKPFELGSAIQTICLPSSDVGDLVGETSVTAGWGKTKYMGESSSLPREVDLPVVTNQECARAFNGTDGVITKNMLCAGVLDGSVDACQGDSGGPLMWFNKNEKRWQLVGIVSFGVKCATPGYYGVYTRVSNYIDWIQSKVPESKCSSTLS